ncbi:SAM-dependent methyltransferase [Paenibacillus sp. J5C_2022]|uniref:class I SAM-dependent methyltransferase n=1 Tax=Paenibacillus sp. J5C2022 TaxID=2977129 RepID=UPI0021D2138E|nr:SAM-dependent methyltransferase [Paenibacillus sp. J5C2022]MCU6711820.1 SAM-dependent methyltransferase [Paenibacillus sp. J5C2022]
MQEAWQQDIIGWMGEGALRGATLSGLRRKDKELPTRIVVRPIILKNGFHYQFESHFARKVTHMNVEAERAGEQLLEALMRDYKQALLKTPEADVQILLNKKGKASIRKSSPTGNANAEDMQHNRQKQRVLQEGDAAPFLVELGIMTPDGHVKSQKQDKYRQINRFLEMVGDVMHALPQNRTIQIVDFGCGKSYLTFALYHLLKVVHGFDVNIAGLDLKADVISFCSDLSAKLGYEGLAFQVGDIAEYEETRKADMVVTLHACDTATDAALAKAVHWGASVIMSVPCCQHELFRQVRNDTLAPILSHGLLKERFAALATDAARGSLLEVLGYKVQMLEFVDPEHTPKNLLIRAVKGEQKELSRQKWEEYKSFKHFLHLSPALERALAEKWPD